MIQSAICTIARNEGDYLQEWITYHLELGFDHIFLYDNNDPGDDSTARLCAGKPWEKRVTLIDYRGRTAAQLKAYNECFARIRTEFDWVAFIDADEFVTFGEGCPFRRINAYLKSIREFDVLFINWMYYGDNGQVRQGKEGVTVRFPLPLPDCNENKHVKSIVKSTADIRFVRNPHCPDGEMRICDTACGLFPKASPSSSPLSAISISATMARKAWKNSSGTKY